MMYSVKHLCLTIKDAQILTCIVCFTFSDHEFLSAVESCCVKEHLDSFFAK